MAEYKNVTQQERILAEAQKKLDRIEKMREQMIREVEIEMQMLDKMREQQDDFTQSAGTQPSLSNTAPASFQSQFDQFNATKSNERLKPLGNEGIIDFTGKLEPAKDDTPFYSPGDRDQHWTSLIENPGKPVYASGRYVASPHGNEQINAAKEYEYIVSARALPISVGDVLKVPVHPMGHNRAGKIGWDTDYLQYQITDIYTTPKYYGDHDRIE